LKKRKKKTDKQKRQISVPNPEWARKWVCRHPSVKMRFPTILEISRVRASTLENLRPFFATLLQLFCLHMYDPADVYNFDETSLRIENTRKWKVTCTSSSSVSYIPERPVLFSSTAGFCVSASGKHLKTCLILKKDFPPEALAAFDDETTSIFTSQNGWMTRKIFKYHMFKTIVPKIQQRLNRQFLSFVLPSYSFVEANFQNTQQSQTLSLREKQPPQVRQLPNLPRLHRRVTLILYSTL
jgi:hypothetical protein